jgi:N-acetylglucosamine-6-phosphate deacetylase
MEIKTLIIKGPKIYTEDEILIDHQLVIERQCIKSIEPISPRQKTSAAKELTFPENYHLIPGMIDLHIHGAFGADVMDCSIEALETISNALPKEGVTSFLATTMTAPKKDIEKALSCVKSFTEIQNHYTGAQLLGVHLEGPFISPQKKGAQNEKDIIPFDESLFANWQKISGDKIKIITLAPEIIDKTCIKKLVKNQHVIISAGHSNATYQETLNAIDAGVSYATHLFNGMRAIDHREPGVAIALLLSNQVCVELIADGFHLHPEMIKLVTKLKPLEKIILVTDAMCAKGMPEGVYELGGQKVKVKENKAILERNNNVLAGSVLTMNTALKNFMAYSGLSIQNAIKTISANQAKKINVFNKKGSIALNKDADLVVLNERLEVILTICQGNISFQK